MEIAIYVFVILLFLIGIWKLRQIELKNFRKTVEVGYYVTFRHKGVLITGVIVHCDEESVTINSKYGPFVRQREEIWL